MPQKYKSGSIGQKTPGEIWPSVYVGGLKKDFGFISAKDGGRSRDSDNRIDAHTCKGDKTKQH